MNTESSSRFTIYLNIFSFTFVLFSAYAKAGGLLLHIERYFVEVACESLVGRKVGVGGESVYINLVGIVGKEVVSLVGGQFDCQLHYQIQRLLIQSFTLGLVGGFACLVDYVGQLDRKSVV